jgi:uncharacterized membrane protein YfcA
MINEVLILLAIGICAGILSGLLGVGGGTIIVPSLVFFMGMSQHEAQGTSLALMLLPIGLWATKKYHDKGAVNIKFAMILAGAFVLGSFAGAKISLNLDEVQIKRTFAIVLIAIALKTLLFDLRKKD